MSIEAEIRDKHRGIRSRLYGMAAQQVQQARAIRQRIPLTKEQERKVAEMVRRRKVESIMERLRSTTRRDVPIGSGIRLLDIAAEVCAENGATLRDLRSRRRSRRVVYTRQEFFYLARVMTTKSYPEIGRYTGHDHTTVIHGAKAHAARNGLPAPDDAEAAYRPLEARP